MTNTLASSKYTMRSANQAYLHGEWEYAAEQYEYLSESHPSLAEMARFNLQLIHSMHKIYKKESLDRLNVSYDTLSKTYRASDLIDTPKLRPDPSILETESYTDLRGFGAALLGPLFASYFLSLSKYLNKNPQITMLRFLAREGYVLERAFTHLKEKKLIKEVDSNYLLCSRTLLFKIALIQKKNWSAVLNHHFKGCIGDLLAARFQFSDKEIQHLIAESGFNNQEQNRTFTLPDEKNLIIDFFTRCESSIKLLISDKHESYIKYLSSVGFGDKGTEHLVDIGYSGTIQKLLTEIAGCKTVGHYFMTTSNARRTTRASFLGHISSNLNFGDGCDLLDRSLFIEAILTAPHGQVIDVQSCNGNSVTFFFGATTGAQHSYDKIEHIIDGAISYAAKAIAEDSTMDFAELNDYYSKFVANLSIFPKNLHSLFEIDDNISGLGILNPIDFFKKI